MESVTPSKARHIPGEEGIWLFIAGDLLVFSLFFGTYLYFRADDVALFAASQAHLNQAFGAFNTFLMLSSSWFVALAVQSARRGLGKMTPVCFSLAFLCGLGFVAVKVLEYGEKIRAGITLNTNDFYMYYFMFTGIHLMHVLIGLVVLGFLVRYSRVEAYDAKKLVNLESGASFWHLVDLLWIILFALLYLVK